MGAVRIAGLSKAYGAAIVLDGIGLEIGDGAFFTRLGPSGCCKSTVLRPVAGFIPQVPPGYPLD